MGFLMKQDRLYRFMLMGLLVGSGIQVWAPFAVPGIAPWLLVILAAWPVIFVSGYQWCGLRGKLLLLLLPAALALIPLLIYGTDTVGALWLGALRWSVGVGPWVEESGLWYHLFIVTAVSLLLCLAALGAGRFALIRALLCIGFVGLLGFCFFNRYQLPFPAVVSVLLFLMVCYIDCFHREMGRQCVVYCFPFLAAYLCLMACLPISKNPYRWPFARLAWDKIQESAILLSQRLGYSARGDFSLKFTGLADSAGVSAGPLFTWDRDVMVIETDQRLKTNLYLTAAIMDTFQAVGSTQLGALDRGASEQDASNQGELEQDASNQGALEQSTSNQGVPESGTLKKDASERGALEQVTSDQSVSEQRSSNQSPSSYREYEWISTGDWQRDYQWEMLETMYAISRYDPEAAGNYAEYANLTLEYLDLYSRYLLLPTKTYRLEAGRRLERGQPQADTLFDKKKGYGTVYRAAYMQMNWGHEDFLAMAEQESRHHYGSGTAAQQQLLADLNRKYGSGGALEMTEAGLRNYADTALRAFAAGPDLSVPVANYLREITRGCDSKLDILQAIEAELNHFTYTLEPPPVPAGQEFLDFFLLEAKEGYCTYFATAFVLLARAEGIPVRYVQGYCVPGSKNHQGELRVNANMAHAWPEAYLEGIGWVPFEPTPTYGTVRYASWERAQPAGVGSAGTAGAVAEGEGVPEEPVTGLNEGAMAEPQEPLRAIPWGAWIRMLLALAGIVFIAAMVDLMVRKYRFGRMGQTQKLKAVVAQNLRILEWLGYPLVAGQTMAELWQTVKGDPAGSQLAIDFITSYEQIRYGKYPVMERDLELAISERGQLLAALKRQRKLVYYWMWFKI